MRIFMFGLSLLLSAGSPAQQIDARQLVLDAMEHWRGMTSQAQMTMSIHRPDWQRSMSIRSWSKGNDQSLVRVVEPKKDAGTSTLVDGNSMWIFTPKVNRIIKVPSSMMAQAWMGSDFSNKDISKSTDIIDQYDHTLIAIQSADGHRVYEIESIPHDDAAVVWGKEVLLIRDDFVLLEQQFWSQDNKLVKVMKTLDIQEMGGRQVARILRMESLESPGEWTQLVTEQIEFGNELPASLFTLSNLRNPRL
jgi:outer membrane lipoprotein-sorting protein